jgi:hypothetical protein
VGRSALTAARVSTQLDHPTLEDHMGKTGRKRRARKKKGANHGKRPNA